MATRGSAEDLAEARSILSDEELLEALDEERRKFTQSNEWLMDQMIEQLIARGVYSAKPQEGNPSTTKRMVECYGATWHIYRQPLECPHCKTDLRDMRAGPPFKREIGIEANDRVSHFECPDCQKTITR